MADISVARMSGAKAPTIQYYPIADSQTIKMGDPVVLIYDSGADPATRVTILTSGYYDDFTTDTGAGTDICGVLGFAAYDITSSSTGTAVSQITPSSVDASAVPIYPIPQIGAAFPDTTEAGVAYLGVWVADSNTEFKGLLTTAGSAITVNEDYIGTSCGLVLASSVWSFDVAGSGAFVITDVCRNDTTYNTSSALTHAIVRLKPTYQQGLLGHLYAVE